MIAPERTAREKRGTCVVPACVRIGVVRGNVICRAGNYPLIYGPGVPQSRVHGRTLPDQDTPTGTNRHSSRRACVALSRQQSRLLFHPFSDSVVIRSSESERPNQFLRSIPAQSVRADCTLSRDSPCSIVDGRDNLPSHAGRSALRDPPYLNRRFRRVSVYCAVNSEFLECEVSISWWGGMTLSLRFKYTTII